MPDKLTIEFFLQELVLQKHEDPGQGKEGQK